MFVLFVRDSLWYLRCQCLQYDICNPEDIIVDETEMFICRLMMQTYFSCEIYSLWSVEWFLRITRTRDLNHYVLSCSWVRHFTTVCFQSFILFFFPFQESKDDYIASIFCKLKRWCVQRKASYFVKKWI